MLQQTGFGLAVAVLIDATLVRSVLVPAAMRLLGRCSGLPRRAALGCEAGRARGR
jgi:RND superfamily putative drug exporter